MADGIIQVPADSVGKKVDTAEITVGGNTVERQRIVIGDDSASAQFAIVTGGALMVTGTMNISATASVVIAAGTANIGTINNISATLNVILNTGNFNIGTVNAISAPVALAAGTANIGSLNNISATVACGLAYVTEKTTGSLVQVGDSLNAAIRVNIVADLSSTVSIIGTVSLGAGTALIGGVSLVAGTANIGFINNISATVIVAGEIANGASLSTINKPVLMGGNTSAGGAGGLMVTLLLDTSGRPILGAGTNNIGAVSLAAGTANIGFINGISQTISTIVLGKVAHGASITTGDAPAQMGWRANFSAPAANISNGASFGWSDKFGRPVIINNHPSLLPTASHGPRCITCSTSAGIALIAAPGAGLSIFITEIANTNGSATLTRADVFEVSKTASCVCQMYMAASGGGFVMKYDPPIQLTSNSGATCRVKPSVSQTIFNVHFYVGPK